MKSLILWISLTLIALTFAASGQQPNPSGPIPDGLYNIIGAQSGKCLTPEVTGPEQGRNLQIFECHPTHNYQKFNVISVEGGYKLKLEDWTGYCLDVENQSPDDGALIRLHPCNNQDNEIWAVHSVSPGSGLFGILPKHMLGSGQCLQMEVRRGSVGDRSAVTQGFCAGGKNQQWRFIPTTYVQPPPPPVQIPTQPGPHPPGVPSPFWQCANIPGPINHLLVDKRRIIGCGNPGGFSQEWKWQSIKTWPRNVELTACIVVGTFPPPGWVSVRAYTSTGICNDSVFPPASNNVMVIKKTAIRKKNSGRKRIVPKK